MHDTYPTHFVLFDLISLETMHKQYKFSCSHFAVFVQPSVTFCLLHASDLNVPRCSHTICLSHIMKEPPTPPLILSKKKNRSMRTNNIHAVVLKVAATDHDSKPNAGTAVCSSTHSKCMRINKHQSLPTHTNCTHL